MDEKYIIHAPGPEEGEFRQGQAKHRDTGKSLAKLAYYAGVEKRPPPKKA